MKTRLVVLLPLLAAGLTVMPAWAQPTPPAPAEPSGRSLEELQAEAARLRAELAAMLESLAQRRAAAQQAAPLAAPAPVAAPSAQPPAAAAAPTSQPPASTEPVPLADVQFAAGSAEVSQADRGRLAGMAQVLRTIGVTRLKVVGFSDRTGQAKANEALALARARAVARALVAGGVPEERTESASYVEAGIALPVETPDGIAEPLNRAARVYGVLASAVSR